MKKYLLIPSLILSLAVSIGFGVLKQQSDFLILLTKQLAQYQKVASEEKTYLHVDRSFYTVGDDIWFKGYLLDGTSHAFSQLSDLVYVELLSPKGNVLAKLKLPVNSGIYHGDFALPANAPGGIYQVLAYTEWMKNAGEETFFRKKIQVQNVVIPRLLMTMDFQQKAYGPGATVHADLSIRDLQDQPIARTSFDITAAINGKTYLTKTLQTDKEGKAVITFNLPENLQSNDGLLALKFNYEGTYESISRSIPIVLNNIDLQFFPEGGNLLANQQNRVAFKAINEFGKGADVSGEILDSEGNVVTTFESYHMGMGSVSFTPNAAEQYVAKITAPVQLAKQYALPKSNQQAYGLALSERSSKGLIFNYFTPNNEAVNVVAQVRGKVYDAQTIRATKGMNQLTIPIHDFPTGIAQITLFNAAGQPQCERLAFVNANKKLNVSLQTDKKEYEPREKVELSIRTTDHLGKPVPTNLSLAVVDDKIVSFADDKQDHILSWMLMSSDLKGTVEEPSFYFKSDEPKAAQALDLVMMTHGWRRFNWKEITSKNIKLAHTAETFDVIQGQLVQHQSHRPIAGKVYLIEMEEEGRMVELETDSQGKFVFYGVDPTKNYQLLAQASEDAKLNFSIQLLNEFRKRDYGHAFNGSGSEFVKPKVIQGEYVEVEEDMIEEDKTTATVNRKVATKNSFIASANTFSLSSSSATLEEIVVVSYSTSVNLQGTNSSATLQPTMSGALVNTLSGKVAGVQVTPASGASSLNEIRIRGSSSINSNSSPLVVLDGIPLMNTLGEASSDLNLVNAENIKNMTVLKGGTATALYGSRGAHGVILITTKRPNEFVKDMIWKPAQYIAKYVAAKTYSKVREFYAPAYQVKKSNEERIDFRNTIFWEPNVQTDKNGTASLSFYNSDATTVFRMIAEGVGINGQVTRAEETYHTILPFSMDAKVPPYLTFEDKLELPVILKNNTNQTIKGKLLINVPEQLESLNGNVLDVSLKAQDATTIYVPLFVKSIAGKGTLGIQFKSKTYQDEFVKDIDVESKGFPVSFSLGGNELNKKVKFIISDPVAGSIKADFIAYRDVVGQLMDGLESIFREPHGCFEQTSSSTYPNLLALSYLRESGRDNPEIETKALGYIKKGYKRLISFECPKGGFDWFGRGPASVWLTAYGVMEFNDMKAVYNGVSQPMINRTLEWLLQQQNESGRFSRYRNEDQHDYHKHYNRILNAYVVYALANAQVKNINRAYQHAYQDALSSGDAYLLGLVANAAFELGNREEGNALLAMLKKQIRAKGMQSLKVSRSITYGRGVALQVEAASLTVLAMLQARDQDMNLLNNLVKFIASKNRFGGYGNTQATIMALRALVAYAKQAQNKFEDGKIEVTVNNRLAAATSYSQEQKEGITYDQLGQYFTTGEQQLGVQFLDTKTAWPYSMNVSYTSYTPVSSSKCEVDLIIKIASEQIDLGGTVRLTTTVQNKSSESQGMVMALIGIPSGLSPQPWQLKELQEKRVVDYYEVHKNYLVCYFTGMEGNEKLQVALDLKAEVPGTYQAPASSAYLYYTDEYKDWEAGLLVRIER